MFVVGTPFGRPFGCHCPAVEAGLALSWICRRYGTTNHENRSGRTSTIALDTHSHSFLKDSLTMRSPLTRAETFVLNFAEAGCICFN